MSNFARIINNVAVDVSTNPQEHFHPDIAAEFEPVPDDVQAGWARNEAGEWEAPAPTPEPTPVSTESPKVFPVEFKLLFTAGERVTIKAARASDPVIDDFLSIIEDPRLTHVNLGLQSTQDAFGYLETKGFITDARRVQILAGKIL